MTEGGIQKAGYQKTRGIRESGDRGGRRQNLECRKRPGDKEAVLTYKSILGVRVHCWIEIFVAGGSDSEEVFLDIIKWPR